MSIRKAGKHVARKVFVASGSLRFADNLAVPPGEILRYPSTQDRPEQFADTIGCTSIHATAIFERHMQLIAKRFRAVSMDDVALFLRGDKSLPQRAVAITFDDGYQDNFRVAAPILNRFGIPPAFYLLVDSLHRSKPPSYRLLRPAFMTSPNQHST